MHRKLLIAVCLFGVIFNFLGCSGKPPDWIMGTSNRFPSHSYLIGVGRHVQAGEAEQLARRQVEQRLGLLSYERQSPDQLHWHALAGAEGEEDYLKAFRGDLEAIAVKIGPQIRIADFWEDRSTSSLYALAVMDRARTLEILRQELVRLDQRVSSLAAPDASESSPVRRLGKLLGAMDELNLRFVVAADIDTVSTRGYAVAAPVSASELDSRIESAAKELFFGVSLKGTLASSVRGEVIRQLAGLGLSLAPPWAQNLTVTGEVNQGNGKLLGANAPHAASARIQFLEKGGDLLGETTLGFVGQAEQLQSELAEDIVQSLVQHLLTLNRGRD